MTRGKKEIEKEIAALKAELDGMSTMDQMGVRQFARASGLSIATASRIKNGNKGTNLGNLLKALPFMKSCPCCGQDMPPNTGR